MSDGRLQVTHYAANPAEKPEIYNFFFVGPDGALVYREKRQLMAGRSGECMAKLRTSTPRYMATKRHRWRHGAKAHEGCQKTANK
jgi:hypothetical protein